MLLTSVTGLRPTSDDAGFGLTAFIPSRGLPEVPESDIELILFVKN